MGERIHPLKNIFMDVFQTMNKLITTLIIKGRRHSVVISAILIKREGAGSILLPEHSQGNLDRRRTILFMGLKLLIGNI